MYVHAMYSAYRQQLTYMLCTNMKNHEHVHTCTYISENVCTRMYMVCTWYVQSEL